MLINKYIKFSDLIFYLCFIITFFLSIICNFVLPNKFFNDAFTIIYFNEDEISFWGSYPFSALFYKVTYLRNLPFWIVGIIQITILFYLIKKIGIPRFLYKISFKNIITILSFFIIAFYINVPSKEFITFIFIFILIKLFFYIKSVKKSFLICSLLIIFFGIFFRAYFIFILIISCLLFFLHNFKIKNYNIFIFLNGIFLATFISLSLGFITGKNISERSKVFVNEHRIKSKDPDANSIIIPPLDVNTWYGELTSAFHGFISVNLPFNALKFIKKPHILAFTIWQIILLLLIYNLFLKINKLENKKEYFMFLFLISYFISQGFYEPDLGSSIRHKMGIFPLIYFCLYYNEFNKHKKPIIL